MVNDEIYQCENASEVEAPVQTKQEREYRAVHQDLLDSLPRDIVREMAKRRHEELKAAGYDVPDW
jgi:hypothetical protein